MIPIKIPLVMIWYLRNDNPELKTSLRIIHCILSTCSKHLINWQDCSEIFLLIVFKSCIQIICIRVSLYIYDNVDIFFKIKECHTSIKHLGKRCKFKIVCLVFPLNNFIFSVHPLDNIYRDSLFCDSSTLFSTCHLHAFWVLN